MRLLDTFAGIGGFSLGLERAGMETVAFCEIDPFCQKVLKKHWPDVPLFEDIRELTVERLTENNIFPNIISGGFPCQDISVAGGQAGLDGERSGLWSELHRLVSEVRPEYLLVENVRNLLSGPAEQRGGWFGRVLGDLAEIGYDTEWDCIPACFAGAWHKRDRVWLLAYPVAIEPQRGTEGPVFRQRHLSQQLARIPAGWPGRSNLPAPTLCGGSDGVPSRAHRTKALGNSIYPPIAEMWGRAIVERENEKSR